jgi:hypothetical protein
MKLPNPEWSSTLCIILPNASGSHVLALPDPTGWRLPTFHPGQQIYVADVTRVNDIVRPALNANVTVLYCAFTRIHRVEHRIHSYYVMEEHSPVYVPPQEARWVRPDKLASSEQQEIAAGCLNEDIPELRPPWSRRGWFHSASAWMQERLVERGLSLRSPVEQRRNWGLSCVLSGQTESGRVYFKTASRLPLFANEPALVQALSQCYPASIPAALAVSDDWLLMTDVGMELRSNPHLEQWLAVLGSWAKIQKDAVTHIDYLMQNGCLDRRLEQIPAQFETLLQAPSVIEELNPEEIEQLRTLIPRVSKLCERLQHYHRVPQTLIHGDFHSGNIANNDGLIRFFDWTDGAISHPFLDLITFLDDAREWFPDSSDRFVEVYLANWLEYEPMERLKELWDLAEPLSLLYQAISYQHIKVTMEQATRENMNGAIGSYLRRAIRHLLEKK